MKHNIAYTIIVVIIIIISLPVFLLLYGKFEELGIIGQYLAGVGLSSAALIALYKWVIETRQTSLDIIIDAFVLKKIKELALVSIIVHLNNKGVKKVIARTRKDIEFYKDKSFLYEDKFDKCNHAGTLKIRRVRDYGQATIFDWYSLDKTNEINWVFDNQPGIMRDLEQINYLNEYESADADNPYKDVDFWIEPNESYNLELMILLSPGNYAVKAYFLGRELTGVDKTDYWSNTKLFCVE